MSNKQFFKQKYSLIKLLKNKNKFKKENKQINKHTH